jgi:Zn-dependent peptidase ImmA (M78 family)
MSSNFIETPKSNLNMRSIEENALLIRQQLGIDSVTAFDPFEIVKRSGTIIKFLDEIEGVSKEIKFDAKTWSGTGMIMQDGKYAILLNPNQTRERMNVTVLEEIAHKYYKHVPNVLGSDGRLHLDKSEEEEAYWTAAAILVPSKVLAMTMYKKESAAELAKRYGASVELVEMRIKLLNFWTEYKKQLNNIEEKRYA